MFMCTWGYYCYYILLIDKVLTRAIGTQLVRSTLFIISGSNYYNVKSMIGHYLIIGIIRKSNHVANKIVLFLFMELHEFMYL